MDTHETVGAEVPTAVERFAGLEKRLNGEDYNFEHFRTKHFVYDALATKERTGIQPGEPAPDFTLPIASGGTLHLADLRGRPVLLRFGSPT